MKIAFFLIKTEISLQRDIGATIIRHSTSDYQCFWGHLIIELENAECEIVFNRDMKTYLGCYYTYLTIKKLLKKKYTAAGKANAMRLLKKFLLSHIQQSIMWSDASVTTKIKT